MLLFEKLNSIDIIRSKTFIATNNSHCSTNVSLHISGKGNTKDIDLALRATGVNRIDKLKYAGSLPCGFGGRSLPRGHGGRSLPRGYGGSLQLHECARAQGRIAQYPSRIINRM